MANVPTKLPRYRELPAVPGNPPKTAWGLFGANDNVGMFNLQTPDDRRRRRQTGAQRGGVCDELGTGKAEPAAVRSRQIPPHRVPRDSGRPPRRRLSRQLLHAGVEPVGRTHARRRLRTRLLGRRSRTTNCATATTNRNSASITGRGAASPGVQSCSTLRGYRAAQGRPLDCGSSDAITIADLEGTVPRAESRIETGRRVDHPPRLDRVVRAAVAAEEAADVGHRDAEDARARMQRSDGRMDLRPASGRAVLGQSGARVVAAAELHGSARDSCTTGSSAASAWRSARCSRPRSSPRTARRTASTKASSYRRPSTSTVEPAVRRTRW